MKFPPNIKIPDSLKGVFKKSSTPDPLREPRRNPKDNIPLNFRERSNARVSLMASVIVLAILVLFFNQLDYRLIRKPAIDAQKKAAAVKAKADQEAADTTAETTTASVIAVGDNLYHQSLIDAGASSDGNWNYDKIYTHIQNAIKDADIKMIDQETVFTTDHDSVSSYPSFATPTEVGDAIIKAGFNVVESANNHIDDFGEGFLTDTLNFWKTKYPDVTLLGIHDSQEDADTVKIREVNGIKIAFLDYTYGTNVGGIEGKDYMIDMIRKDKITAMIQKAKQQADCIIFVAHWGTEDETMPNEYEKQWAAYLMEQGVNVIIGGHPHVLQPYGRLTDDKGNETVVFYSLGNFVSTQQKLEELLGGMAKFTIQKTVQDGKTSIEILTPTVEPLVMHYNSDAGEFGPYMLSDYTEELASQNGVQSYIGSGVFTLDNLKKKFNEIMSMNVTPSTGTNLLDVTIDTDLNMIDASGNVVEDTDSITAEKYYADKGIDITSENFNSADNNSGSTDDSSDDGSYDDSYSDDGSYDDGSYDDGSYDDGSTRLEFEIPARGLIGFRGDFMTSTKGTGILNTSFDDYAPYKGDIQYRKQGSLIAFEAGESVTYGLFAAQERGTLFIGPGERVYAGMVIGQNGKAEDIELNVCKTKHLTNTRSSSADDALKLTPPKVLSLEQALEFIDNDELLEITPTSLRIRKKILDSRLRKRANLK